MKAVLPALTGQGYESLAIQEGGAASREFLRVTFGDVTAAERRRVRRDLENTARGTRWAWCRSWTGSSG